MSICFLALFEIRAHLRTEFGYVAMSAPTNYGVKECISRFVGGLLFLEDAVWVDEIGMLAEHRV